MQSEAGLKTEAYESVRLAFQCCRQADEEQGLMTCSETWGVMHVKFGDFEVCVCVCVCVCMLCVKTLGLATLRFAFDVSACMWLHTCVVREQKP